MKAVSRDSKAISKTADCFNYGECFTATIPLYAVTKPNVTPQGIHWLIKPKKDDE